MPPTPAISAPPELPESPRPLSAQIRRRATWEPRVRFWIVLTIVLGAIAMYVLLTQLAQWSRERSLVLHGVPVAATVTEADLEGGRTNLLDQRRTWNLRLRLHYLYNNQPHDVEGNLTQRPEGQDFVVVGKPVQIKIDPASPETWTDRTEAPPFANAITSLVVLFPIVLATGLWAIFQRSSALETYRTGELVPAGVLSASTTPIAPAHTQVSAQPTAPKSVAVTVYVPRALGVPHRSDVVWILVRKSGLPLAATAFL